LHLVLLGSPGTGKGTQANVLKEKYGWLHVSTGDLLRDARANATELGKEAAAYMDAGKLVPNELVIGILLERIGRPDATAGFILDGFPRNLVQAEALDEALAAHGESIDLALSFVVADDELVRRLGGRWICPNCGAIYQESSRPPKEAGKCDVCGAQLTQRDDDKPETVRARIEAQRTPADLIGHYRGTGKLVEVDGAQDLAKVTADVVGAVENAGAGR
jgi:adenylate kinase